jgi:hypothetical protein
MLFLWPAFHGFGQSQLVLVLPELLPAGDLRIGVRGAPDDFIFLEYAPESVGPWSTLAAFHLNASGTGEYIDNTVNPRRLYRARNDGQTFSVNIVGYANVAVPATGFAGNPFLTTNGNAVATVLPNASNGMVLLKIGASGYQNNDFLNGWSNPTMSLLPGEGFFLKDLAGAVTTVTLLGEVVNGNCNRLPAGLSLASSIVPRSGLIQSQLQFPAADDDQIFIFNRSSGAYDLYQFFFGEWMPSEPSLTVGQAFWCSKSIAADWSQTGGGGNCSYGPTALNSGAAQVNFFTYNPSAGSGRAFRSDGVTPLGTNYLAQLYAGMDATEASLVRSGTAVRFLPGNVAGYVRGGTVNIAGMSPGQTVYLQVRAWDSALGTNYEAAAGGSRGKSTIFSVTAGGDISYFPPEANNFPSFSLIEPPTITQQPLSQTVLISSNVVFSVTVSGDGPFGYQWYFANTAIHGATNATFSLTNVQPGHSGDYYVVVSNAFGLATSAIATLTVSPCVAAPSGLIASWKGEGNGFDAVGENHGTLVNGVTFTPGKVGSAFDFGGVLNRYVSITHASVLNFDFNTPFTVEAWIRISGTNFSYLATKNLNTPENGYKNPGWFFMYRGHAGGGLGVGLRNYNGLEIHNYPSNLNVGDANWHHAAFTYDGSSNAAGIIIYLDGNPVSPSPSGTPISGTMTNAAALELGAFSPGIEPAPFNGLLDELSIYNRALSSNEIAAIYAAGSLGKCVPSPLPGAPVILVNGQPALNIVTQVNVATIEMETPVRNGGIYFTLDGSEPGNLTGALRYTGPFILAQSATIRALAYSADLTSAADVHLVVIVPHAPAIVAQPQNQTAPAGSTVQFSVSATGDAPLAYQWRKAGIAISGATGSSLLISNVQPANAGAYSVGVTNLYGAVTSVVATLTVIQPPHVTTDPVDVFTGENQSAGFCVNATGDGPLRYQWRKNGVNIPGATNRCYTNLSVRIADGGLYSVAIENGIDAIESAPARLTIAMPISFGSDAFAERVAMTEPCFSASNVGATSEPGEPRHANKPGGRSIWYKWVPPINGIATFETTGSSFDTLLAVYTGTNVSALTLVAADEDRGGFLNSRVRFNAVTNREYQIVVDGYAGAEGTYAICWSVTPAPVPLPVIVQQPHSFTVLSNQPYTLSVVATSTAPRITYQWFFNGRSLTNETNTSLVIPAVRPQQVGSYWAGVSNSGVGLLSDVAVLEIGPFANIQSVAKLPDLFVFETNSGFSPTLRLRGLAAAADAGGVGISVGAGSINTQIINNTGTAGGSNPAPCRVLGGTPRYLLFLATNNATMRVDTFGSAMDTVLGMLVGTSPSTAVPMLCNDDAGPGATNSLLQFSVTTGNGYFIQADGKNAAEGSIFINWAVGSAPASSQSQQNYTVLQGDTLILTNLAIGTPPPSFQWRHQNIAIPQATNQLLALTNIQPADGGTYLVVTSNALGRITNTIAIITVQSNAFLVAGDTFGPAHLAWASSNATTFFPVSGGNPGGYLSNRVAQGAWRLLAPPDYSSNKFHCYDGLLSFDLRLLSGVQISGGELSLEGRNLRLALELAPNPVTTSWTTYHVLLNETASGWRWHTRTNFGTPVTREQFLFVLTTLTNVAVLGQFDSNGGSLGIDNVFLLAPTSRVLSVRRDGAEWVIEWPWAIGYYDVESATTLSEEEWAPLSGTVTRVGSLNSIRLAPATQQFFRLRQRP